MSRSDLVPIAETTECSFAVSIDLKNRKEHILIGEYKDLLAYLHGNKAVSLLYRERRELGAFLMNLDDCAAHADTLYSVKEHLIEFLKNEDYAELDVANAIFSKLYQTENPIMMYTVFLLRQELKKARKRRSKTMSMNTFLKFFSGAALPFSFSVQQQILERQKGNPLNPLAYLDKDFLFHIIGVAYTGGSTPMEYFITQDSIMPIVVFYLKRLYDNHLFIQKCPVCKKLFTTNNLKESSFCSPECIREKNKINKQKYDKKVRDIPYEQSYRSAYMYWYKGLKKIEKMNYVSSADVQAAQNAMQEFCSEALKKKKSVADGGLDQAAYIDWLLKERDSIDLLVAQYKNIGIE